MGFRGQCWSRVCWWETATRYTPVEPPAEPVFIMTFTDVAAMEAAYFIDASDPFSWVTTYNYLFDTCTVDYGAGTVTCTYPDDFKGFIADFDSFFNNNLYIVSIEDQNGMIESIGNATIFGCFSLLTLDLPGLTTLADAAITSNAALGNTGSGGYINFPLLTTMGQGSLDTNIGMTEISLPSLTTVSLQGLVGCSSLTTVTCASLIDVAGRFVQNCTALTTVNFPVAETFAPEVFSGCTGLVSTTLPSATTLANSCFINCANLETVNLPVCTDWTDIAGVSDIFKNCTSLTTVYAPLLTNMGGTAGDNTCFDGISGNTITLTVDASLETIDGGNPDGDIVAVSAANTVTVNYV